MIKHFYKFVNRKHRKNKEKTRKKLKTKKNKTTNLTIKRKMYNFSINNGILLVIFTLAQ